MISPEEKARRLDHQLVLIDSMEGCVTENWRGHFRVTARSAYGRYRVWAEHEDLYMAVVTCHQRWLKDKLDTISAVGIHHRCSIDGPRLHDRLAFVPDAPKGLVNGFATVELGKPRRAV